MTTKLSGSMPSSTNNGLDTIEHKLVQRPAEAHFIVGWVVCQRTTVNHENGEITPSMKIKRRSVETNFAEHIEKMYEGSLAQI